MVVTDRGNTPGRMFQVKGVMYGTHSLLWPSMLRQLLICVLVVLAYLPAVGVGAVSYYTEPSTHLVELLHVRGCRTDSRSPHATIQCFAGNEDGQDNTTVRLTLRGLHFPPLTMHPSVPSPLVTPPGTGDASTLLPSLRVCLRPSVNPPLEPLPEEAPRTTPTNHAETSSSAAHAHVSSMDCPLECVHLTASTVFPTQLLFCTLPHPRHLFPAGVAWMDVTLLRRIQGNQVTIHNSNTYNNSNTQHGRSSITAAQGEEKEDDRHVNNGWYVPVATLRHAVHISSVRVSSSRSSPRRVADTTSTNTTPHTDTSDTLGSSPAHARAAHDISFLERLDAGEAAAAEVSAVLGVGGLREPLRTLYRRVFVPRLSSLQSITRRLAMTPVRGVVLHGPPGMGKTLMARRLMELLDRSGRTRVTVLSAADVLSKYVGESEQNIRDAVLGQGRFAAAASHVWRRTAKRRHRRTRRSEEDNQENNDDDEDDNNNLFGDVEGDSFGETDDDADESRAVLQRPLRVIVMDELDALCHRRSRATESGEEDNADHTDESAAKAVYDGVTNTLLSLMDGLHHADTFRRRRRGRVESQGEEGVHRDPPQDKAHRDEEINEYAYDDADMEEDRDEEEEEEDVLIIGLTNRLHVVDRALLRPGRFEVVISIPLPHVSARAEIFTVHTAALRAAGALDPDVHMDTLAQLSEGFTGADIAGVVRLATSYALQRYGGSRAATLPWTVRMSDMMRALTELRGAGARTMRLPPVVQSAVPAHSGLTVPFHTVDASSSLSSAPANKEEAWHQDESDSRREAQAALQRIRIASRWLDYDGTQQESLSRVLDTLQRVWASPHRTGLSVVLLGPAGTGKTALAHRMAHMTDFEAVRYVDCRALVAHDHRGSGAATGSSPHSPLTVVERALAAAVAVSRGLVVLDDVDALWEGLVDATARSALWYRLERFVHEPDPLPVLTQRVNKAPESAGESERGGVTGAVFARSPHRLLLLLARESSPVLRGGPYRHDVVVRTHRLTRDGVQRLLHHHRVVRHRESVAHAPGVGGGGRRDDDGPQRTRAARAAASFPASLNLYEYYRITDGALRALRAVPHKQRNVSQEVNDSTSRQDNGGRATVKLPAVFADVGESENDAAASSSPYDKAAHDGQAEEAVAANFYSIDSPAQLRRFGAAVRVVMAEMGLMDPYESWREEEANAVDEVENEDEEDEVEGEAEDEDGVEKDFVAYMDAAAAVEVVW